MKPLTAIVLLGGIAAITGIVVYANQAEAEPLPPTPVPPPSPPSPQHQTFVANEDMLPGQVRRTPVSRRSKGT